MPYYDYINPQVIHVNANSIGGYEDVSIPQKTAILDQVLQIETHQKLYHLSLAFVRVFDL